MSVLRSSAQASVSSPHISTLASTGQTLWPALTLAALLLALGVTLLRTARKNRRH